MSVYILPCYYKLDLDRERRRVIRLISLGYVPTTNSEYFLKHPYHFKYVKDFMVCYKKYKFVEVPSFKKKRKTSVSYCEDCVEINFSSSFRISVDYFISLIMQKARFTDNDLDVYAFSCKFYLKNPFDLLRRLSKYAKRFGTLISKPSQWLLYDSSAGILTRMSWVRYLYGEITPIPFCNKGFLLYFEPIFYNDSYVDLIPFLDVEKYAMHWAQIDSLWSHELSMMLNLR